MSEADFAKKVLDVLALHGRKVLRVSDYLDARRGRYGLRAVGQDIASTGADYLVLPRDGMKAIVCRDISQVRFLAPGSEAFFLELKDEMRRATKTGRQGEQERWLDWVSGGSR